MSIYNKSWKYANAAESRKSGYLARKFAKMAADKRAAEKAEAARIEAERIAQEEAMRQVTPIKRASK